MFFREINLFYSETMMFLKLKGNGSKLMSGSLEKSSIRVFVKILLTDSELNTSHVSNIFDGCSNCFCQLFNLFCLLFISHMSCILGWSRPAVPRRWWTTASRFWEKGRSWSWSGCRSRPYMWRNLFRTWSSSLWPWLLCTGVAFSIHGRSASG